MSKTIDERVVQMRFDNKGFEENVKESIKSLEELQKSLDVTESTKALENLSEATKELKLDGIAGSVQTVGEKFNALEAIAIGALMKIGAQAVTTGEQLVKSLTVDNIAAGWQKFADKTKSVGTLISQGFDMSTVEEQMERLAWFTDETSYNYTDMVENISKFTATGQDLKTSVNAMEGIALWAAMSGQNAQKASMAMYQLSQAMSKGALKYDDWKSIQNASMDTQEFRQKAVEAAVALKQLDRVGNDTFKTLGGKILTVNELFSADYMSKQAWFTKDVMMNVFSQYAAGVDKIYEKAEEDGISAAEAMDLLGNKVDAFGLKAFKAGQECRSWSDVIDSIKDAVSSGWMKTFELIFGNYEEATVLWSNLAEVMYEVFVEGLNERNELLEEWKKLGGRDELLATFRSIGHEILTIIGTLKEAFGDIFPAMTAEKLWQMTLALRNFVIHLRLSDENVENLKNVFHGLFSIIKLVCDIFNALVKAITPVNLHGRKLFDTILKILGEVGRIIAYGVQVIETTGAIEKGINGLVGALKTLLSIVGIAVVKILSLVASITQLEIVQNVFKGIVTVVGVAIAAIVKFVSDLIETIKVLTSNTDLKKFETNNPLLKFAKTITSIGPKVKEILTGIGDKIKQLADKLKAVDGFSEKLKVLFAGIVELKDKIVDFVKGDKLEDGFKGSDEAFAKIKTGIENITNAISKFTGEITVAKLVAAGFTLAMIAIAKSIADSIKQFGGAAGSIKTFFNLMNKGLKSFVQTDPSNVFLKIAASIAILAGSVYLLSKIDADQILKLIGSISILMGELMAMFGIVALVTKFVPDMDKASLTLISLSASLLIVAGALYLLEGIETEGLAKKVFAVVGIVGMLVLLTSLTGEFKGGPLSALKLLIFSMALVTVVKALSDLCAIPIEDINERLKHLIVLMVSLSLMALAVGNINVGTLLGLLGVLFILKKTMPMLKEIAEEFDPDTLISKFKNNEKLFIYFGAFAAGLVVIGGLLGKGVYSFGKGIIALAAAIVILSKCVGLFENLKRESVEKAIAFIAAFSIFSALLIKTSRLYEDEKTAILKFAAAMIILTGCMAAMLGLVAIADKIGEGHPFKGVLVIGALAAMIALLEYAGRGLEKVKTGAIIGVVIGLMMILTELIVISIIPFPDILGALIAIGGVMFLLSKIFDSCENLSDMKVPGMLGLLAMVAILAELGLALKLLSDCEWLNLAAACAAMSLTMLAFAKTLSVISNVDGRTIGKEKLKTMLVVAASVAILGATLALLANCSWVRILAATIAMRVTLKAFGKACESLSKMKAIKKGVIDSIYAVALAMIPIAAALTLLAQNDWKELLVSTGVMIAVMYAMVGAVAILGGISKFAKDIEGAAVAFGVLAVAMIPLAFACKMFESVDWTKLGAAAAALVGMLAAAALLGVIGTYLPGATVAMLAFAAMVVGFAASMLIFAAAIRILTPALIELQSVNLVSVALGLGAVAIALALFGVAGLALALGAKGILALAAAILIIGAAAFVFAKAIQIAVDSLEKFQKVDVVSLTRNFQVLGVALAAFGDSVDGYAGPIFKMSIAIAALGIAIKILGVFAKQSLAILPSLAKSLVVTAQILNNLNARKLTRQFKELAKGIVAIGAASIVLSFGALGLIAFGAASWLVAEAINVLTVGLERLSQIDTETLSNNICALFNSLGLVNENTGTNVLTLAEALVVLGISGLLLIPAAAGFALTALALPNFIEALSAIPDASFGGAVAALGGGLVALALAGILLIPAAAGFALSGLALPDLIACLLTIPDGKVGGNVAMLAAGLLALSVAGIALILGAPGLYVAGQAMNALMPPLLTIPNGTVGGNTAMLAAGLLALAVAGVALAFGAPGLYAAGQGLAVLVPACSLIKDGKMGGNAAMLGAGLLVIAVAGALLLAAAPGLLAGAEGISAVTVAMDGAAGIVEGAAETIGTAVDSAMEAVDEFVDGAGRAAKDATAALVNGFNENSVVKECKSIWYNIGDKGVLQGLRDSLDWHSPPGKILQCAKDCVTAIVNGTDPSEALTEVYNNFKTLAEEGMIAPLLESIQNGEDVVTAFLSWLEGIGGQLNIFGLGGGKPIKNFTGVNDLMDYYGVDNINELSDAMKKAAINGTGLDDVMKDLTTSMGGAGGAAKATKDEYTQLAEKIAGQIDIFAEFTKKTDLTSDKLLANMRSQIEGVSNWANMLTQLGERGIDQGLLQYLSNLGPQGYEYVNAFVNMSAEQLDEASQLYQQSLVLPSAAATAITDSYAQAGMWSAEGFKYGLEGHTAQAVEAAKNMGLDSLEGIKEVLGIASPSKEFDKTGVWCIEGFIQGISGKNKLRLLRFVEQLASGIMMKFKNTLEIGENRSEVFYQYGTYICQGLVEGIEEGSELVAAAMEQLAGLCAKTFTVITMIASPSKLFKKFGGFLDEGLAIGINDNTGIVKDSVGNLAGTTIDTMREAISKVSDAINSDMDANPTITPVLDLSNVMAGADAINSMLGNSRAYSMSGSISAGMNAGTSAGDLNVDASNKDVVNSINDLRSDMRDMASQIGKFKMVLNSGALVGELIGDIDMSLGARSMTAARGL